MKTSLVIMAAGMGCRFGEGIKQLEPVGPNGEIIMDYSISDAIDAGFNEIIFIIRKDIEQDFKNIIGDKISKIINTKYVFQDVADIPTESNIQRTKPWGTGQAILSCKNAINNPFAIINADDYYGKEAFVKIYNFLVNPEKTDKKYNFCMAGFILSNTLSKNGSVTRGICIEDDNKNLLAVDETKNILKENGEIIVKDTQKILNPKSFVSMNMWGFSPDIMDELENRFIDFLNNLKDTEKDEYLIPIIIDNMLKEQNTNVKILPTEDRWFGMTYQEDKISVRDEIKKLINNGKYKTPLF